MNDPLPLNDPLIERREAPSFDVGVLLERTYRTITARKSAVTGKAGEMKVPIWTLRELLLRKPRADSPATGREKTIIHDSDEATHVLWTGFKLEFFRDGGESYWHTLVGQQQELFVVCQDDEDGEFTPILVTADYDEAMAYQEADDTILNAPMPEKIYHVIERFVLENYAPDARKKRKRKEWHGEESDEAFARKPTA